MSTTLFIIFPAAINPIRDIFLKLVTTETSLVNGMESNLGQHKQAGVKLSSHLFKPHIIVLMYLLKPLGTQRIFVISIVI